MEVKEESKDTLAPSAVIFDRGADGKHTNDTFLFDYGFVPVCKRA
jgi:hypothetical protein